MRVLILSFLSILLMCNIKIDAQQSDFALLLKIEANATLFTIDILGNIYVVNENIITKYNKNGKKLSSWSSVNNGIITSIDASDPMKILVHFGEFGVITLLDNTLSPISASVSLSELGYIPPLNVCSASEGGFWIFDKSEAQLHQYSSNLKTIIKSPEIRFNNYLLPEPSFMLEHNNNIYISDTAKGVIITDKYGTVIRTLPFTNIKKFHCYNNNFIYCENNNIVFFNINTLKKTILSIPFSNFYEVKTDNNRIYILNNKGVNVYKLLF